MPRKSQAGIVLREVADAGQLLAQVHQLLVQRLHVAHVLLVRPVHQLEHARILHAAEVAGRQLLLDEIDDAGQLLAQVHQLLVQRLHIAHVLLVEPVHQLEHERLLYAAEVVGRQLLLDEIDDAGRSSHRSICSWYSASTSRM